MALQVMTANRLLDGEVVYLGEGAEWVEDLASAKAVEDKEEAAQLEEQAKQAEAEQQIVAAYLIKVARSEQGIEPVSTKEAIRAKGPTVRHDLGKQAR